MFRVRRILLITLAACGVLLSSSQAAWANEGWRWPANGAVSLEYGDRYVDDQDRSCTHGGLDVRANDGDPVSACTAGEVTFSGLVPAGKGHRAWAVTVATADGLRVTYLPLSSTAVVRGQSVDAGQTIGELDAFGDASSAGSHLHLGVRRGERALDPRSFLGAAAGPATQSEPSPEPSPAPKLMAPTVTAPRVQSSVPRPAAPPATYAPVQAPSAARVPAPLLRPVAPAMPGASMPGLAPLNRIPAVATAPRLRTAAVAADVSQTRELVGAVLIRLVLAGAAGACIWPVLRKVMSVRQSGEVLPASVRRSGA